MKISKLDKELTKHFIRFYHLKSENMDFRDIIAGCKNKKRPSQNEMFKTFAPTMLSICLRYLKDQPRAEDALIKGFKKVYDHIKIIIKMQSTN